MAIILPFASAMISMIADPFWNALLPTRQLNTVHDCGANSTGFSWSRSVTAITQVVFEGRRPRRSVHCDNVFTDNEPYVQRIAAFDSVIVDADVCRFSGFECHRITGNDETQLARKLFRRALDDFAADKNHWCIARSLKWRLQAAFPTPCQKLSTKRLPLPKGARARKHWQTVGALQHELLHAAGQ
jgi:hypothetical protein